MDISKIYVFLGIYARYLYHEKKFSKTETLKKLDKFMESYYPQYNPVDWSASLEKYASKAKKYPLCKCDGVWITKNELQTIENLNNKVLERLAFTLLCLAKFRNIRNPKNNNWVNYSNGEIYNMACINTTAFDKNLKLNQLWEAKLIEFAKKIDNLSVRVLFIDEGSEKVLFISDFRKLGYEWRLYKGEKYIRCGKCKILTKQKSNHTKYCKECAKISVAKSKYLWDINNKIMKSEKSEN